MKWQDAEFCKLAAGGRAEFRKRMDETSGPVVTVPAPAKAHIWLGDLLDAYGMHAAAGRISERLAAAEFPRPKPCPKQAALIAAEVARLRAEGELP